MIRNNYRQSRIPGVSVKKGKQLTASEVATNKWKVDIGPTLNPWPKELQLKTYNSFVDRITLTGTETTNAYTPIGAMSTGPFAQSSWMNAQLSQSKGFIYGQPLNLPAVYFKEIEAVRAGTQGTTESVIDSFYRDVRYDFLHDIFARLPYPKDDNSSNALVAARDVLPTAALDILNQSQHRWSGLTYSSANVFYSPFYEAMWVSSVKVRIPYTISLYGLMNNVNPSSTTANFPVAQSNVLRLSFTPFNAFNKQDSLVSSPDNPFNIYTYSSYDGNTYHIGNEDATDYRDPVISGNDYLPFPTSHTTLFGTRGDGDFTISDVEKPQASIIRDIELVPGMRTITGVIEFDVVPHKFLDLRPMDGGTLNYKDLAWGTQTDLTLLGFNSVNDNLLHRTGGCVALARQALIQDDVFSTRGFMREVSTKSSFMIGLAGCAALLHDWPTGLHVSVDYEVQMERNCHYYNLSANPTQHDATDPSLQIGLDINIRDNINAGKRHLWPNNDELLN